GPGGGHRGARRPRRARPRMSVVLRRRRPRPIIIAPAERNETLRRVIDVTLALLLLIVCLPVLLFGMLVVLIGSGRPVFFGHVRVGRNGQPFRCWKLRTMDPDAEERL